MSVAAVRLPTENHEPWVFTLLNQVCDIAQGVADGQSDFSMLHESIKELERLLLSLERDEARAAALLEDLSPDLIARLHNAYWSWEFQLEFRFAQSLGRGEKSLSSYLLYDRFEELVKRELALVSGVWPAKTLLIGSGPLPISAIHVHFQTGLTVDCVLQDARTLPVARQALEKCGLSSSVRVFCETDTDYDVSEYDIVVIEVAANPKKRILRTLRKHARPGCQILLRTSTGLGRLVYCPTPERDFRGFHVKARQASDGPQTISTLLLEAAGSAAAGIRLEWLTGIDSSQATQLLGLMNRTLAEETTIGYPGPIDDETGYALLRKLNADVQAGSRHVLVAEKDGVIVGQLILTPNSTPNHHHLVELTRGTIDPSFRGGGLALRAFQEVAKKCEELGREVICLDVRAGTLAAMWWQHFGFKPFGLLSDYSRVGEKRYQGLYLFQTTADLIQRVKDMAATHSGQ